MKSEVAFPKKDKYGNVIQEGGRYNISKAVLAMVTIKSHQPVINQSVSQANILMHSFDEAVKERHHIISTEDSCRCPLGLFSQPPIQLLYVHISLPLTSNYVYSLHTGLNRYKMFYQPCKSCHLLIADVTQLPTLSRAHYFVAFFLPLK